MIDQPVLTLVGAEALQAAKAGGEPVILTQVVLGYAAREATGLETVVVLPIGAAPIASRTLDPETRQLDLRILVDGAELGLQADRPVREVGVFDQAGRLIFYFSTLQTLGSVTPETSYALTFSIALASADAAVIQVVDQGPPWGTLFEARLQRVEASRLRNLFLALS